MNSSPAEVLATHSRNMATAYGWRRQLLDLIDAVQRREAIGDDDGR
ncbi:MAG: hypothetical protein AB1713_10255 [Pseudomonadota bacterium]